MHFAVHVWMAREFPGCPFERYADDAVVHCVTRRQAEQVLAAIVARMSEVGLRLHPDKTWIGSGSGMGLSCHNWRVRAWSHGATKYHIQAYRLHQQTMTVVGSKESPPPDTA